MPKPIYDSSKPNPLFKARIEAALERMRGLEVSPHDVFAFSVAQGSIEITREMQKEDPEVVMHGTCEAYMEAEEESLHDSADAWLSFLLKPPTYW